MPLEQLLQQEPVRTRLHPSVHHGVRIFAPVVEGGTEIAQLGVARGCDQDVVRVAVSVCEAAAVQVRERGGDRDSDALDEGA